MPLNKVDWKDVLERAEKTAVQTGLVSLCGSLATLHGGPTRELLLTFLGAAAGAGISAAWNVVEDAVKTPTEPA